jgi:hypothetical protein
VKNRSFRLPGRRSENLPEKKDPEKPGEMPDKPPRGSWEYLYHTVLRKKAAIFSGSGIRDPR